MTLNLTFKRSHLVVRLCVFLLVFSSNVCPNSIINKRLNCIGDLKFYLSRLPKVEPNGAVGVSIYGFLLMCLSKHKSTLHRLVAVAT